MYVPPELIAKGGVESLALVNCLVSRCAGERVEVVSSNRAAAPDVSISFNHFRKPCNRPNL
jgi:hypothetical protein